MAALAGAAGVACEPASAAHERLVTVERGAYHPAISPDGSTIAVGVLGKIWLLPIEGGEARPLTSGHGWDHHPAWSPDGTRLAWVHDTPAASEIVLHTFASGTSRTLYGRSPAEAVGSGGWGPVYSFGQLAFHPSNGRLYFIDFRSGIWSIVPTASRSIPAQLLPGSGRLGRPGVTELSSFAFSPDGQRIAVERDTTDLWTQLHVGPLDSLGHTEVTTSDRVRRGAVHWAPDGGSLVYLELERGREALAVHPLDGGAVRRLPLGAFNGRALALYPEGNRALLVSGRQLFAVDLTTGSPDSIAFRATLSLPPRAEPDLVITNARLFDGTGAEVVEGATVEVRDGKIFAVTTGPFAGDAPRVIDAGGRFLMPGLVEGHNHVSSPLAFVLGRVPALGVTSLFDAGSYLRETMNLRDAIEQGVLEGPRIYTAGPTIDGPAGRARPLTVAGVADAEDARALVRELARQGVDAVKIYAFLEPEATAAVIAEAHAQGLPAIGDLVSTPWPVALEAGIDGFVHLMDHKWRFVSREQPAAGAARGSDCVWHGVSG